MDRDGHLDRDRGVDALYFVHGSGRFLYPILDVDRGRWIIVSKQRYSRLCDHDQLISREQKETYRTKLAGYEFFFFLTHEHIFLAK